MMVTGVETSAVKSYVFQVFQYPPAPNSEHIRATNLESVKRYRDAVVWRLLCLEDRVDTGDLYAYWEILDALMDLSVQSAIQLLQNLYEYEVRKLQPLERKQAYPGIANDLYRLEYRDAEGGCRDVCVGTLLQEAIDLLHEEATYFIRKG